MKKQGVVVISVFFFSFSAALSAYANTSLFDSRSETLFLDGNSKGTSESPSLSQGNNTLPPDPMSETESPLSFGEKRNSGSLFVDSATDTVLENSALKKWDDISGDGTNAPPAPPRWNPVNSSEGLGSNRVGNSPTIQLFNNNSTTWIQFSIEMLAPGTDTMVTRVFGVDTSQDIGKVVEIFADGQYRTDGQYALYHLPEGTSKYEGFVFIQPDLDYDTRLLGLYGDLEDSFVLMGGRMSGEKYEKYSGYTFATPEFFDVGTELVFEALKEDDFFEREKEFGVRHTAKDESGINQEAFLPLVTEMMLEQSLPLEESDPAREKIIDGWLETYERDPDIEEKIGQTYGSGWVPDGMGGALRPEGETISRRFYSLGLITGDNERQVDKVVDFYNLDEHSEAVFRDYRILIDNRDPEQRFIGAPSFTDDEKQMMHDVISGYEPSMIYRTGIITILDLPPCYNGVRTYPLTPHYGFIEFNTWRSDNMTAENLEHHLGHIVDMANPLGLRPNLLNQNWIRQEMYHLAFEDFFGEDKGYNAHVFGTGTDGADYGYGTPFVTDRSRVDRPEFSAEEWAYGAKWYTTARLNELIVNATTGTKDEVGLFTARGEPTLADFASLRHLLTFFNIEAYNSPGQNQVPIYRDPRGSRVDHFPVELSCVDNPNRHSPECNITRIDAPLLASEAGEFDFRSVSFEYEPLDPEHPDYDFLHIRTITVEYKDGRTETFTNPLLQ